MHQFTPTELRKLRALRRPEKLQRFLEEMPYHHANSAWSPRKVLHEGTAHCLEGAVFAAAALRVNGFEPLLLDLEAVEDSDHVLALFKLDGHWGAIGKSNYAGLRYRDPVYRSLRELALSYFDVYFNLRGERTLRAYSNPVNLARFDHRDWMTTDKDIWFIAEHLCGIRHFPLLTPAVLRRLTRIDKRSLAAGMTGHQKH
jgi:hypothetical protein